MRSPADIHVLLAAFSQELARCGVPGACTCPGSRNTPLLLALAREPGLACYSHVDERAAGFFALGLAKATGLPAVVTCTSGTAAAELFPAVIEAREARVPLIVLTADRPSELRDNGAGQAIDQLHLYGRAVKLFAEVELGGAGPSQLRHIRTLACRAFWTAIEGRPGAVHLNFPLREPLLEGVGAPVRLEPRPDGRPWVRRSPVAGEPEQEVIAAVAGLAARAQRPVLVAGRDERPRAAAGAAGALASAAGWPLLADPMSGARRGEAAIAHYDALLQVQAFTDTVRPDLVLRVGDLPVSKPLRSWLAGLADVTQVALDPDGAWQDPDGVLSESVALEPARVLQALAEAPGEQAEWLERWRAADALAASAITGCLERAGLSEPAVAVELGALLPPEATLFVASSMPVRDIESFWPARARPPRVLCNRGANGIDGTVSSAFGAAAAGPGPVVLLIGDVALAHDVGGLLAAGRLGLALTIVLLENGGGGIFDFLPIAASGPARESEPGAATPAPDIYTAHVATPTGLDAARIAGAYGLTYTLAEERSVLREALRTGLGSGGASLIEVRGERAANLALHRRVREAVAAALA